MGTIIMDSDYIIEDVIFESGAMFDYDSYDVRLVSSEDSDAMEWVIFYNIIVEGVEYEIDGRYCEEINSMELKNPALRKSTLNKDATSDFYVADGDYVSAWEKQMGITITHEAEYNQEIIDDLLSPPKPIV